MITHKFREVTAFADEVTVLRRGRVAGSGAASELHAEEMAEMMVGAQPPRDVRGADAALARRPPALVIDGLHADDDLGLPALDGVDLTVRAGEIVGIAGVSGNGQDELVEVLAGQRRAAQRPVDRARRALPPRREQIRRQRCGAARGAARNACVPG